MAETLTIQDLAKLSMSDRLRLLDMVWESLHVDEAKQLVPAWHLDVVKERLARFRANPNEGVDVDQFLDSLG